MRQVRHGKGIGNNSIRRVKTVSIRGYHTQLTAIQQDRWVKTVLSGKGVFADFFTCREDKIQKTEWYLSGDALSYPPQLVDSQCDNCDNSHLSHPVAVSHPPRGNVMQSLVDYLTEVRDRFGAIGSHPFTTLKVTKNSSTCVWNSSDGSIRTAQAQ